MAVRFDADESYTSTSSPPAGTAYTVTCWAKISVDRNTWSCVWDSDSSTSNYLYLATDSDGTTMKAWCFTGGSERTIAGPNMTVGTWYRFALVANGANATLYYGTASGALTAASVANWLTITGTTTFRVGADVFAGSEWLNGCVANLKHYSTNLTQAEVEFELAQYIPTRLNSLVRWHPFIANETTDYSGNARTLSGGSGTAREDGPPIPWHGASLQLFLPIAAGSTPVVATDNATLTESSSVAITSSSTDTASAADTSSISASTSATDSAAVAEAAQVGLPAADAAALSDQSSSVAATAATDSSTLSETSRIDEVATDQGALTESSAITAQSQATDAASLAEASSLASATADSASFGELTAVTVSLTATDAASFSDSGTLGGTTPISATDSAVVTETVSLTQSSTDSATLTQSVSLVVVITASDTGAASDASSLNSGSNPAGNDLGTLTESASVLVMLSATEAASMAEAASLSVLVSRADSASVVDTGVLARLVSGSDAAVLMESAAASVLAGATDSGELVEAAGSSAVVTTADNANTADIGGLDTGIQNIGRRYQIGTANRVNQIRPGGSSGPHIFNSDSGGSQIRNPESL